MLCRWHSLRSNHRVCSRLLHDASQRSLTLPRPIIRYVNQRFVNHSASKWVDTSRQRRKDLIPTIDTIYALSTAPGRAAIAIIRISGPACLDIYGGLCPQRPFPVPRVATLRKLFDPVYTHEIIDPGALVLYFPAPKTVTGEDLLELHVHGGPAIVRSLLQAIPRCIDTRPRRRTAEYSLIRAAEPGEFTKRAFYNGVIDLTQAEALGETLAAETEQQRKLAVTGSDGGMAARYEQWRQQLLYARGEMEALIDFSEDQHFDESPATFLKSISNQIKILERQIELHIENANRGELLRSGISVALLGAPNAGKSSLLNQIVGREAAIVSSEPGTTRDIVDVQVDIGGWLVKLGDMAGLRTGNHYLPDAVARDANSTLHDISLVEQEGIRRARERALHADVIIALIPLQRSTGGAVTPSIDREVLQAVRQCQASGKAILYVVNKTDLMSADDEHGQRGAVLELLVSALPGARKSNVVFVSCRDAALQTGRDPGGVQAFLTHLMTVFSMVTSAATGVPAPETSAEEAQAYWSASLSVTHRQSTYLRQCLNNLRDFQCMHDASTTRGADQCRGLEGRLASSVDDHVDLVGEVVEETASSGLTDQCDRISAVAAPGDHPPLSADYGLGHLGESLDTNRNREVDIVQAAEHLRYAADCLAKITGRGAGADVEEVLGVVFEK